MRVLIDGYWWASGPPANRLILRELVSEWSASTADELIIAVPAGARIETDRLSSKVSVVRTALRKHPFINVVELPRLARRLQADTVVAFNFAAPIRNSVLYLFDVLFQDHSEWFSFLERRYLSPIPRLARIPASVVTLSESERRRILACNPQLRRVVVSGLECSTELMSAEPVPPHLEIERGTYLLAVGRLNVRKNLWRTVAAALEAGLVDLDHPFVVVGDQDGKQEEIPRSVRHAITRGEIRFTGHVSIAELRWLYEHCRVLCYFSLGEGFGLPPLEAMYLGIPVAVTDLPVFHETLGTYAEFANPLDPDDIARAIRDASRHPRRALRAPNWHRIVELIRHEAAGGIERGTRRGSVRFSE